MRRLPASSQHSVFQAKPLDGSGLDACVSVRGEKWPHNQRMSRFVWAVNVNDDVSLDSWAVQRARREWGQGKERSYPIVFCDSWHLNKSNFLAWFTSAFGSRPFLQAAILPAYMYFVPACQTVPVCLWVPVCLLVWLPAFQSSSLPVCMLYWPTASCSLPLCNWLPTNLKVH